MIQLTESQGKARTVVSQSSFSLLTGGGGTGKTTLLAEWLRQTPDIPTGCFAPTGKAAQRMEEAFLECGVSLGAKTIHSGLIPTQSGYNGRGWKFQFNRENPLPCSRVLIDEFSMVGSMECSWLLSAIGPNTQVVAIGDVGQLPPVGKGRPFKDMIDSGVFPNAHLTEVHRYAGRIAHVCKSVRDGQTIQPSPKLDLDPDASEFGPENYRHIERRTSIQMLETIDLLCEKVKDRGFSPMKDMQVIVTRNDAGGICRKIVNPRLQQLLNPNGGRWSKCPFRIGDKVVCKRNAYREEYIQIGNKPEKTSGKLYTANGEDGIVHSIDDRAIFVQFRDGMVRFGSGGYEREVVMGYALTTHSVQGSGYPIAAYMIDDCRLNDRQLVYTGLSRAKKIMFTVGRMATLQGQLLSSNLQKRKTFLKERLLQGI